MANTNTINYTRIETLTRENYDTWRIQIEALLIKNRTWAYVSGEKPKPEVTGEGTARSESENLQKVWLDEDRNAKSDLILSISPSELKQIRGCVTSNDVWKRLEATYASKGPARKAALLSQITQQKMAEGADVREHLTQFYDAVDKLEAMNVEINGDLLAIMILNSLPANFDSFRVAIQSRDDLPDPDSLRIKIIEIDDARKQKENDNESGAMFVRHRAPSGQPRKEHTSAGRRNDGKQATNDKRVKYKCSYCGKVGHKLANCFAKRKAMNEKANVTDQTLIAECLQSSSGSAIASKWCLDSGCTSHLCNNQDMFIESKEASSGLKLASDAIAQVKGKGHVRLSASVGGMEKSFKLENTLLVPDLRTNLLSVSKIVDKGNKILFTKNRAVIKDSVGNVKLIADRDGDLFFIRQKSQQACAVNSANKSSAEMWHERLGHLNSNDMNLMRNKQSVFGLNFSGVANLRTCETCLAGKATSLPFSTRTERSHEPLEIVHSDVCGPMRVESQGGARYFVTFIGDYSRWCAIYFIRNKSDVVSKFVEFKNLVETQTGRKIKALQTDNGKEYCNASMDDILKKSGIRRRLTTVHTPQQNGVAERKNRTLVESARCMLLQSGLSSSFWAEAISTACYIQNRCVTRVLDKSTPYEKWTGKRPYVGHFRTFGAKIFVLDKTPNKGKFEKRSTNGIFVGYSEERKAYRVWIPNDRKVISSRDVRFLDKFESKNEFEDFMLDNGEDSETRNIEVGVNEGLSQPVVRNLQNDRNDSIEPILSCPEGAAGADYNRAAVPPALPTRRGRGRPHIVRTGNRGRPSKVYRQNPIAEDHVDENHALPVNENVAASPNEDCNEKDRNLDRRSSSDDEGLEWHDADFAMSASEIPLAQALNGPDADEWKKAIYSEIKCLVANDTWELVSKPDNEKIVDCRMVLRNKYDANGNLERRKARLVAKGFTQRPGIDFQDTFAPVARLDSFRLLMALSVELDLNISQLDVTTAYLNGDIDKEIYMNSPDLLNEMLQEITQKENDRTLVNKAKIMLKSISNGANTCKLKKALYGLRQAGRQWHAKLSKVFHEIGLIPTNADPCVYVDKEKRSTTIVLVYVDDILIASNDGSRVDEIKVELSRRFSIKDLGSAKYCLGIEISRKGKSLILSQTNYIKDILRRFRMEDCNPVKTPLAVGAKLIDEGISCKDTDPGLPYRELVGALMYVALGTRPDISHAVSVLCQFNSNYKNVHWLAAKRILRYLKGTLNHGLVFSKGQKKLIGFVDADWANCKLDRRSFTGSAFILANSAITWESRKQRTVALSSTEAEYMAISDAAKQGVHLLSFLKELGLQDFAQITLFNDNQGAKELAHNPVFHSRTKHIDVRHHFVRQILQSHPIKLEYLPTDSMTADVLTKGLTSIKHEECTRSLGVQPISDIVKTSQN